MFTQKPVSHVFSISLVVLILLGSTAFPTRVRAAATITVNSLADTIAVDGDCTLREAIQNANNDAATNADCAAGSGADNINFSVNGTIMLASGLPAVTDVDGLTIDGTGQTITISGASTDHTQPMLQVNDSPLTLSHLTVSGGYRSYDGGGALNSGGGNVTIIGSTFSGNSVSGSIKYGGPGGGAIMNWCGTLTISGSTFSSNSVVSGTWGGGAIRSLCNSLAYPGAVVTITNSTFSGNSAPGGKGGAIVNAWTGTMSITNTTFSGNSVNGTGGLGGAIYGDTTTLTLTGDTFSNNTAAYGSGGAIYDETGTSLVISNSRFTGNSAGSSGAIYDSGPLTITMSTFANNSASDGPGGGLYSAGNSSAVANTTFSGNSASGVTGNGGGIYNTNSLVVTNGTFSGNSAAASGGAVYNAGSTLILRNTIVNASTSGGNCGGTITNGSHNIDSGATCGWDSLAGSKSNTNPMLGALTGSPAYFPLTSGSPAVDAGDDSFCSVWPVSNQSQNSVTRPQGAHCDIGSYEKLITNRTLQFQSIGAVDGWILESSENSNVGKTLSSAAAFNLGDNAQKKQYRSVLSFSTKDLPDDAIITKVTLKFKKQGIVGGGNPVNIFKGFIVDVEKGFFGSAAGLQKSDFQFKADKSYGPFKPTLQNGWYTINLTPAMDYINKEARYGGVTQIRLRFKLDDNNNNIANYLKLYSGNAPAASRPQLVIQYYLP